MRKKNGRWESSWISKPLVLQPLYFIAPEYSGGRVGFAESTVLLAAWAATVVPVRHQHAPGMLSILKIICGRHLRQGAVASYIFPG
jgi:hypothetical protein